MQFNTVLQWFCLSLFCIFLSGCTGSRNTKDPMPKEEKAELFLKMGVRYLDMGKLETAKNKLNNALALDQENAKIHNALGVLHERLQQNELAGVHYQRAISLDRGLASIKNNYGRFLCDRGSYESAMGFLNEALEMPLNNRKWFTYTNIGLCELKQGKQQLAELNFRQALRENGRYSPALLEMQKASYRMGNYLSARAFLQRYLAVASHTAETLWYGVQTERVLGNKQLAEDYREKLLNLFPASKQAQQLKKMVR